MQDNNRQEAKPLTVDEIAVVIQRKTRHSATYCWSVAQSIHAAMPRTPSREAVDDIVEDLNCASDLLLNVNVKSMSKKQRNHIIDADSYINKAIDAIMALWGKV